MKKAGFEVDLGLWGKFQQFEFGKRGFRQGAQNKSMGTGKHRGYLGLISLLLEYLKIAAGV